MEKNEALKFLYRQQLSVMIPGVVSHTDEGMIQDCRLSWKWCEEDELVSGPATFWKVWLGIGMFVFGSTERLEDILELIIENPNVFQSRPLENCHKSAIPKLLPIPESIRDRNRSLEHPELILSWYQKHAGKIHWDPVHGEYTLQE